MSNNAAALATWLQPLIHGLDPAALKALARKIGQALRKSNQDRIRAQQAPDGTPYTPRRPQAGQLRSRVKGQGRGAMFKRLRLTKNLKVEATPQGVAIAFINRVQAVARVHHYGLRDRVRRGSDIRADYPARPLLGISDTDTETVKRAVLDHLRATDK